MPRLNAAREGVALTGSAFVWAARAAGHHLPDAFNLQWEITKVPVGLDGGVFSGQRGSFNCLMRNPLFLHRLV